MQFPEAAGVPLGREGAIFRTSLCCRDPSRAFPILHHELPSARISEHLQDSLRGILPRQVELFGSVGVIDPPMSLEWAGSSRFLIFVEGLEHEAFYLLVGNSRRSLAALAVGDQILDEGPGVGVVGIRGPGRGPTALTDDDFKIPVADVHERHMKCIDHSVENVLVCIGFVVSPTALWRCGIRKACFSLSAATPG